jgi:hypothetical protein
MKRIRPPRGKTYIFCEGWRACEQGLSLRDNPHVGESSHHPAMQWRAGLMTRGGLGCDASHPPRRASGIAA